MVESFQTLHNKKGEASLSKELASQIVIRIWEHYSMSEKEYGMQFSAYGIFHNFQG